MDNISESEIYFNKEAPVKLNKSMQLGDHLIIDLSGCDPELLLNPECSRDLFFNAVKGAGLTVVSEGFYRFSPHGFTCFLLLAESHASLHAWPEHNYCAVDLFTCDLKMDLTSLVYHLKNVFRSTHLSIRKLDRNAMIPWESLIYRHDWNEIGEMVI